MKMLGSTIKKTAVNVEGLTRREFFFAIVSDVVIPFFICVWIQEILNGIHIFCSSHGGSVSSDRKNGADIQFHLKVWRYHHFLFRSHKLAFMKCSWHCQHIFAGGCGSTLTWLTWNSRRAWNVHRSQMLSTTMWMELLGRIWAKRCGQPCMRLSPVSWQMRTAQSGRANCQAWLLDLMPSSLSETMLIVPDRWVIHERDTRIMCRKITILIQVL